MDNMRVKQRKSVRKTSHVDLNTKLCGAEHIFRWSKVVHKINTQISVRTPIHNKSILMIPCKNISKHVTLLWWLSKHAHFCWRKPYPSFDLWNPPGTQHEYLSCINLTKLSHCCLKFGKMQRITVCRIFVSELFVLSLLDGWHSLFSSHGELAEKWGSSLDTRVLANSSLSWHNHRIRII